MTTTPAPAASEARILGVIGIGHGMSHLYYLALAPLFPHLRDAFGVSYAELGLALAVMPLTSAVLQVPIGFMVDRIGARAILMGGMATTAVSMGLMGLCTSFTQLLMLCIVSGAGNAVFHPTDYAILNASIGSERMGRAFSIHTFTGQLGSAAAPALMVLLSQWLGWRMALIIIGLAGMVALALIATQSGAMRDTNATAARKSGQKSRAGLADALAMMMSPPMLIFFAFFTVLAMMQAGLQTFTATALVAQHGTPLATANLALSAYLFASAIGVLIGGELADRTTRHDLFAAIVFAVSAALCLMLAWLDLSAPALMVLMTVMGLGQGATRPARDMMLRAATPTGATGSVFGFVTSGIALGAALAPIPLGWLIDIGRPEWVHYALAGMMLVAMAAIAGQRRLT